MDEVNPLQAQQILDSECNGDCLVNVGYIALGFVFVLILNFVF